ncbi:hypothetical protein ACS0TY_024850 [Phlomoides rotata]
MDASSGLPGVERVRKRSVPTTRRVWTFVEERELVSALKDLVLKGRKCDNGFRSGYLLLLENMLSTKFPGTDLKGEPHINSKIHVWKKQYACLKLMLGNSGIGLNSTTYRIDALPEVWDAHIKVDSTARSLKNKTFPFYADWCDIFGDDRANGSDSQLYDDVVQEVMNQGTKQTRSSMDIDDNGETPIMEENTKTDKTSSATVGESSSATKEKGKGVKRIKMDEFETQFIDTVDSFCAKSDSKFGQIANSVGNIAQRVGSEFDARIQRGEVYERMGMLDFMSVAERVDVAQYLCNNSKDIDLFVSLPEDAKSVMVTRILKNLNA